MDSVSEDGSDDTQRPDSDKDLRVYFVPYRWWKDAKDSMPAGSDGNNKVVVYAALPVSSSYAGPMKIINNIFNSDLVFSLRREEGSLHNCQNGEFGVSGRDFALVSGDMWLQALKWHSHSKNSMKDERGFSVAKDDMADVYPLQLRLSVQKETNHWA